MGKSTGFLEYQRKDNTDIPPLTRIKNFEEFHVPLSSEERIRQAGRCMNCGVPFCQSAMRLSGMVSGCPLHNLIPEWNDQIWQEHPKHAFERLIKTSSFPEFTGRVCPALCEKACMCGQYGDPVSVHDNELYLIENAFEKGYIKPRKITVRSGKKVAVIGSGPAGLAVADELNHRGHLVTVYERDDRIGGLLMYGIPNMKLDKSVIFRRQKLMEEEGVTFLTGMDVGRDVSADEIMISYDAVVLCCGSKQPRSLATADPDQIKGVCYAVDFLKSTTASLLDGWETIAQKPEKPGKSGHSGSDSCLAGRAVSDLEQTGHYINAKGKHVVVVGGGDTGNDCIGTVIRHGCRSVTALEMMPAPPQQRLPSNPWPEWPKILKTDYGHQEAIAVFGHDPRIYETTVKEVITNKKGEIKKLKTVKVHFEDGKVCEVEGSEETLPCDLLLIAAGFVGCQSYIADAFGLQRSIKGTIPTAADTYQTSKAGVFTAGDTHRGQSLVVWAVTEGRACAREVDEYLMGYTMM